MLSSCSLLGQVDILVDETFAVDPTAYDLAAFMDTYNITDNSSFPFMTSGQVYRCKKPGILMSVPTEHLCVVLNLMHLL